MFDWLLLLPLLSRKLGGSWDRTDNLNNIAPPFPVHELYFDVKQTWTT